MASLGMVLGMVYNVTTYLARKQMDAQAQYQLTMMARAILDEYTVTYPKMRSSGVYKGIWEWEVTEAPQDVLEPTQLDSYFSFVNVSVSLRDIESGRELREFYTVVARRGYDQ